MPAAEEARRAGGQAFAYTHPTGPRMLPPPRGTAPPHPVYQGSGQDGTACRQGHHGCVCAATGQAAAAIPETLRLAQDQTAALVPAALRLRAAAGLTAPLVGTPSGWSARRHREKHPGGRNTLCRARRPLPPPPPAAAGCCPAAGPSRSAPFVRISRLTAESEPQEGVGRGRRPAYRGCAAGLRGTKG